MNDKRPVNLDIGTMKLPITAYVSILHRISGVILVAGTAVLLWLLDTSLSNEQSFNAIKASTGSFICKLIVWAVLSGLIYHCTSGIKHLIMDLGIGESFEAGVASSKIVITVSTILILLLGVSIW